MSDSPDVDPVLFILNEKNKHIEKKYIEKVLKNYGINMTINKIDTFKKAMIHKSYLVRDEEFFKTKNKNTKKDLEPIDDPSKAIPLQNESYERLEFLGDSVIHLILAEYLFHRYQEENEGFMTRLRTKIENGDTLSHFAKTIGLNDYVLISRYIEKNEGRENNKSILEDSFEAFIGALFLEGGFEPCKKFLIKLIEQEIDFAQLLSTETNFKDRLLQLFHKRGWQDPVYDGLDISGPDHKKQFTMYVKLKKNPRDEGEVVGIGVGSSKKKGEQEAAKQALIHFGLLSENDNSDSEIYELDEGNSSTEYEEVLTDSEIE